MKEAEFREWLADQGLIASSTSTRISDVRRIEKHFGDLDAAYSSDRCARVFESLAYSADDQAAAKPNPSGLNIDGNLYDGLSGYRSALTAYVRFRNDEVEAGPISQADRIRRFVTENYADPARRSGAKDFTVISGTVHRDMGLSNAMPAVCSALDSRKFAHMIDGELVNRQGPANSSTVSFTFALKPAIAFGVDAAQRELRRRYGEPIPTRKDTGNRYVTSFVLSDQRQIALENEGQSVRIWIEGNSDQTPPAGDCAFYAADKGRQANLPSRLKHAPPTGVEPRPVVKILIPNQPALSMVLDWYELQGTSARMLSREAIVQAIDECDRLGLGAFLDKHHFKPPRTYWIAERGKFFPCKAIANVALRSLEGDDTAIRDATRSRELVSRLGFLVVDSLEGGLDLDALETLKQRFLARYPDFESEGFAADSGSYFDEERRYKNALLGQAQEALGDNAVSDEDLGGRFLDLLIGPESSLLGWRTDGRIKNLRAANPGVFERAAGQLVRSGVNLPVALDTFVEATWATLAEGQEKSLPFSESRNIPSMLLAFAQPTHAIGINTDPMWRACKALTGTSPWENNPLNAEEYASVLGFAELLFEKFEEWGWRPRDLWDVQSFIWVVRSEPAEDKSHDTQSRDPEARRPMTKPTNIILYGPPGTGKTFRTVMEAVRLCDGTAPEDREEIKARYDALVEAGQIGFVTFHQSYAYEDFVEGLRPITGGVEDDSEVAAGFRLEPKRGIFREIAALAEQSRRHVGRATGFDLSNRQFFKMSLGRAGSEDYIYDAAIEGGYIVLGWGGEVDWSDTRYDDYQATFDKWNELHPGTNGNDGNISQLWRFRSSMKEGDIVIVSDGNSNFRAVGEVVGPYEYQPTEVREYNHRRTVRWLLILDESLPVEIIHDGKFTMRSCYSLKPSRMKVEALSRLLPGSEPVADAQPDQFVLIIDEINRANISKVFGELITLIEDDKRLGALNATTVKLPYSGDSFGVPDNLHIVGTMNTADRSIALLDTALRRRFTFQELMPDPEVLTEASIRTGVDLVTVLRSLNERIEYLFDREHQIGHAYFIHCQTVSDVHETMRHRIIPLLAEYFYEDWSKVALVLGDADGAGHFVVRTQLAAPTGMQSDGFSEERYRWKVRDQFDDDAYAAFG